MKSDPRFRTKQGHIWPGLTTDPLRSLLCAEYGDGESWHPSADLRPTLFSRTFVRKTAIIVMEWAGVSWAVP